MQLSSFNGLGLTNAWFKNTALAVCLFAFCSASVAIEEDELRGRVLDVDEQANTLTVRPSEVGEALNIPTDGTQTFEVDAETIIEDDVYATQLDGLQNIRENDVVRISFDTEPGGRMVARTVGRGDNGDGGQAAQGQDNQQLAQADQRAEQLPATASFWPLLAVSGFILWGGALLLRLTRKRS